MYPKQVSIETNKNHAPHNVHAQHKIISLPVYLCRRNPPQQRVVAELYHQILQSSYQRSVSHPTSGTGSVPQLVTFWSSNQTIQRHRDQRDQTYRWHTCPWLGRDKLSSSNSGSLCMCMMVVWCVDIIVSRRPGLYMT